MLHEWVGIVNLFCLLIGFALLADHFERSELPQALPRFLPDDWKGAFALLVMVFVLSAFLDNIAAALIGGAMAHTVFRRRSTSATSRRSSPAPTPAARAASSATRRPR